MLLLAATLSYFLSAKKLFDQDKTVYVLDTVASLAETLAAESESSISNVLRQLRMVALIVAQNDSQAGPSNFKNILNQVLEDEKSVLGLAIIEIKTGKNNRILYTKNQVNELETSDNIQKNLDLEIQKGNGFWQGKPLFTPWLSSKGEPLLNVAFGVIKNQHQEVLVKAVIDQSVRKQLFQRSKLYSTYIVDEKSTIMIHTDIELVGTILTEPSRAKIGEIIGSKSTKGAFESLMVGPDGLQVGKIIAFKKMPKLGLMTIAEIPVEAAYIASAKLKEKSGLIGVLILCIGTIFSVIFSRKITNSLDKLTQATKRISDGDFSVGVPQGGRDEVGILTKSFNIMQQKIVELLNQTAIKARMEKELETAQIVQDSFFPKDDFRIGNFEISGFHKSSSECGGDFWGAFAREQKLYVFVGDATGHGVPAALMTAVAHSCTTTIAQMAKNQAGWDMSPLAILEILNVAVWRAGMGKVKMTFLCLEVDLESGALRYSNASHEKPLIIRNSKDNSADKTEMRPEIDCLNEKPSGALGDSSQQTYTMHKQKLEADDILVCYTDGITESRNEKGAEFGERRLLKSLQEKDIFDAKHLKDKIKTMYLQFMGKNSPQDDVTLVVIKHAKQPDTAR